MEYWKITDMLQQKNNDIEQLNLAYSDLRTNLHKIEDNLKNISVVEVSFKNNFVGIIAMYTLK